MSGASPAFTFVLTMGIVNLFADVTYEGGGSINGQFLAHLTDYVDRVSQLRLVASEGVAKTGLRAGK